MNASHSITDDGVKLTFGAFVHVITESEAKRLAWGILADLDPEEASVCNIAKTGLRPGSVASRILEALQTGPKTTAQLVAAVGASPKIIPARASQLRARGLVTRIDTNRSGRGRLATYALTALMLGEAA